MIGSSFVLRCAIVHDGVMRRSEDELSDRMSIDTSRAVCNAMLVSLVVPGFIEPS